MPPTTTPPTAFQLPYVARLGFVLLSVTLLVYWMHVLGSIVTLLLFSIILSMAMFPLTQWLEKKGLPSTLSITLAILAFTAVFVGIGFVIGYEVNEFMQMLPQMLSKMESCAAQMQQWAYEHLKISHKMQVNKLQEYTQNLSSKSGDMVGSAVTTTGSMLGMLAIVPVFIFFVLYYRNMLTQFLYKVFSNTPKSKLNGVFSKIYEVVHNYLYGLFLVTLIVGTLNSIGLLALGIQSAFFFGFLAAILLIIPYFGILIGSILPIVVALVTKESPMYALGVAGIFFFVQILEGNFITPYIVGSKISINPLAAIVALFLCEMLWGIAGMALALPLTAILKVIFDSVVYLKPYGYVLGEPEVDKERELKSTKIQALERELVETIHETTDEVKAIFHKKKSIKKAS